MSRGPGSIERYLIEEVNRRPDPSMLNVLVGSYARDHGLDYSSHLRSSFRRAANKLAYPVPDRSNPPKIHLQRVWAPTCIYRNGRYGNMRETIVVYPRGMTIEDDGSYLYRDGESGNLALTIAFGLMMIDGLNKSRGIIGLFPDDDDDEEENQ